MDGSDIGAEWGPARGDVRHRIFGFASVPLKFGLRSNLNMRYESGTPYNITTGLDDNGDSVINDRPTGVSRNSARGGGQLNIDLRLSWQKSIGQAKVVDQGPGGQGGGPVIVRGRAAPVAVAVASARAGRWRWRFGGGGGLRPGGASGRFNSIVRTGRDLTTRELSQLLASPSTCFGQALSRPTPPVEMGMARF